MNNENTIVVFDKLVEQARIIVGNQKQSRSEKLKALCDQLHAKVEEFDWVGFYLANPADQELVLGPFTGEPTEHTHIPYGRGICGQSAETQQTFVVQDVGQAENYLSCSANVKAEIVVPIMKNGSFAGQIDIDSHEQNSITQEHRQMLEEICAIAADLF